MSRIRSLHPALFTDERYMALSLAARELVKGIWCEADDQGVFEWKPLTLKARILPADNVDVGELLGELEDGQFVTRFEQDGRSYGAVRNFRRFQRPKKPNSTYLLPPEFRRYVGLDAGGSEPKTDKPPPVPHQFPTEGEKSPQMEDGGWRMEDGKGVREESSESPTQAPELADDDEHVLAGEPDEGPANGRSKPLKARWPRDRPVPMEWVAATAETHPRADGYAEADNFRRYWSEGKGQNTARDDVGWRRTWQTWIERSHPGPADWRDRYGYDRLLHGKHGAQH